MITSFTDFTTLNENIMFLLEHRFLYSHIPISCISLVPTKVKNNLLLEIR